MSSLPTHHTENEAGGFGGEAFYKAQLEIANREKTQLQERLREVEAKNAALLKSLFELSCTPPGATPKPMPIDIVQALKKLSAPPSQQYQPGLSGKGSAYRRSAPTDRAILGHASETGLGEDVSPDYTPFRYRAELKGHSSAVYAIQFSPNGELVVSTSFDRSVCFWPLGGSVEDNNYDPKLSVPDAHRAAVVAVEWTFDSARAVTGGLDQSVAEWDVEATINDPVSRFLSNGLVNSVSVSPANDALVFVGTSKGIVHLFDRRVDPRVAGPAWEQSTLVENDSSVNTIHVTLDGSRFITGDHHGAIKTFDLRMAGSGKANDVGKRTAPLIDVTYNDDTHSPITHIHTSPPTSGEDYGRFMAVNSYDNYIRMYDRGSFMFKGKKPGLTPMHALQGVVENAHWPIKSSFFLGADYRPPRSGTTRISRRANREPASRPRKMPGADEDPATPGYDSLSEGGDEQSSRSSSDNSAHSEGEGSDGAESDEPVGGSIQNALILASGSADSKIYIFDVGGRAGTGKLLQSLEGHKDRVYGVDFHPTEPILASCSADSDIKIWQSCH